MIGGLSFNSRSTQIQKSFLYKMNPSLKIIIAFLLFTIAFLPCSFIWQIALLLFFVLLWIAAKLPFKDLLNVIIVCLIMFIFMLLINWIAYKQPRCFYDINFQKTLLGCSWTDLENIGLVKSTEFNGYYWYETIWGGTTEIVYEKPINNLSIELLHDKMTVAWLQYSITWYSLTPQVLIVSTNVALKVFFMITTMTMLSITTPTIQLTFGIDNILSPLKIFRIPIAEWAMVITIAIRFVPSLLNEASTIMKAQATRGVDFKNGNFFNKTKAMIALIISMFSIAFKKANELSDAMEVRNYVPQQPRTRYRNYKINVTDWVALFLIVVVFFTTIFFVAWRVIFSPLFIVDCYVR